MRVNYRTNTIIYGILFAGLICMFIYGIAELVRLRFSAGDVYPAYSSLRTDPLGTKAYYEALGRMKNISAERNYTPLPRLSADSTLFILGANPRAADHIPEEEVKALETFVSGGGRLVMTFLQILSEPQPKPDTKSRIPEQAEKKARASIAERWGFTLVAEKSSGGRKHKAELAAEETPLDHSVPWHPAVFFNLSDASWQAVYRSGDKPVLIERKYGRGTIVLSTDTYFASNEAVLKDRSPRLLAWLAGPHSRIIFDETHNGVVENPGLASLLRKYNLFGFLAGVALLAALYIWKNSAGLAPAYRPPDAAPLDSTPGKDHLSGMISLLRRNVPPDQLLAVCVQEWKKGLPKTAVSANKADKVEKAAVGFREGKGRRASQMDTYKLIVDILSERSSNGK